MPATVRRTFTAPDTLPNVVLIQAEALWAAATDDADDRLADLLGLGPGDGHDELTRCQAPGCGAWLWADEGADLVYESGASLRMCEAHAVPDDPGCRVYPGVGLEARWREAEDAARSKRLRETGSPW